MTLTPEEVAALRDLLEITEGYCDKGPTGYGWSSSELDCARYNLEAALGRLDGTAAADDENPT